MAPALHAVCGGLGLLAEGPFPRLLEEPLLVEGSARLLLLLPPPLPGALLWDLWLTQRDFLLCCFPFPSLKGRKDRDGAERLPFCARKDDFS